MDGKKKMIYPLIVVFLITVITACDTTGDSGTNPQLSLSFTTGQTQAKQPTFNSSHVTIRSAKLLIRHVEFKSDVEDDGVEDDSLDFKTDSFVVELNLDGSVNTATVNEVKPGSFDEIEFEVHKPEDNETPPDPDFKIGNSGDERFSVIVNGVYEGQDFQYRSTVSMDQEIDINPPLVIDEETTDLNVTMRIDVSMWFVDENGDLLNPVDEDNRSEIDNAIKRSFEIFEDQDKDGEEDD